VNVELEKVSEVFPAKRKRRCQFDMTPITAEYEVYYTIDILRLLLLAVVQTVAGNSSSLQCFHVTEVGTNSLQADYVSYGIGLLGTSDLIL